MIRVDQCGEVYLSGLVMAQKRTGLKNTTTSADWTRWNVKYTNLFADLTHKFNDSWSAKLSYSHGKRDANSKLLYVSGSVDKNTGLGLSPYASAYDLEIEQDNASLQLNGSFDLWGLEQKVVLGYQYSNQDFTAYARSTDTKWKLVISLNGTAACLSQCGMHLHSMRNIILNKMHYSLRLI